MMVLVTGGASCGKSAFAESVATRLPGPYYYLAAMKPYGRDAARRIERHRQLRAGKGFITLECYDGMDAALAQLSEIGEGKGGEQDGAAGDSGRGTQGTALLECLGNVVANEMFTDDGTVVAADDVLAAILDGVDALANAFDNVIIVGNEVGADGVRYDGDTEAYIRIIGTAACAIAARSDVVVECAAGQPLFVKGTCPVPSR